ncbi:hypothetical protein [Streptomyces sp. NPDC002573]|uniref:hypothetical protein n=1 Tax=Streptomyces sp. NPDC002573 TaxID=3364651 RepID=UPI0036CE1176
MAIDPARIQRRMEEAELSGRPAIGVHEAEEALRALAVVVREDPQDVIQEPSSGSQTLMQAS